MMTLYLQKLAIFWTETAIFAEVFGENILKTIKSELYVCTYAEMSNERLSNVALEQINFWRRSEIRQNLLFSTLTFELGLDQGDQIWVCEKSAENISKHIFCQK
jgi:hypothetical protein